MAKNVYLLVTDLHFDFTKANRLNYLEEILSSMDNILTINAKYRKDGCITYLIFMGDVFDRSISNSSEAMQATEIFKFFCSNFERVYSVVGNHEITYAKDNPFWFLASAIEDEDLAGIRRYIQPRGLTSTLSIPCTIVDGDTTIYFNHFGVPAKIPKAEGVRIGVFHQNVGSNDICQMWGTFDDVEEASYIQGYNYCFFGHMHMAKGRYYLNDSHTCIGEWLGTIGRTKVTEILPDSLFVNIPAIIVDNSKFATVEDNSITLKGIDECVDKLKLEASERSKQIIQKKKELITNNYQGLTLYDTLLGCTEGTPQSFLIRFLSKPDSVMLLEYKRFLEEPISFGKEIEDGH